MFELTEGSAQKIYDTIRQAADAYQEAALLALSSSSAAFHARFLKELVAKDAESRQHREHREDRMEEDRMSSTATIPSQGPITPTYANPIPTYVPQLQPPPPGRPPLSHPLPSQPPQGRPLQPSPPLHPTVYANGTAHPQPIPPPVAQPAPPPPPAPVHMGAADPYPLYTSSSASAVAPLNPYIAPPPPAHYASEPTLELTADANYSRHMLESLGFRADYHPNWFNQAMGPSASAGML